MTYSNLARTYINVSAKSNPRGNYKIAKLTPHYMAGNMSADACARYHAQAGVEASANYYIGSDGQIVCGVPEERRAWTSASYDNDVQAITFECANLDNSTGILSDKCYKALVELCADICKRYGINPHFNGGPSGTITYHKMFASTSCPGPWLQQKIDSGQFEADIKKAMNGQSFTTSSNLSTNKVEDAGNNKQWVQDTVLQVGDTVKSISLPAGVVDEKTNKIFSTELGTWIPLSHVDEASDSKDGNPNDGFLANDKARLLYSPRKVISIDAGKNIVKCEGCDYWINAGPLMALRDKTSSPTPSKPVQTPTKPSEKWDQNGIIKIGSIVKSISLPVGAVTGDLINIPDLGGLVPLDDLLEAPDSRDGNPNDGFLANGNSRVVYAPKKVIAIDAPRNFVMCEGCDYWINAGPLMVKE